MNFRHGFLKGKGFGRGDDWFDWWGPKCHVNYHCHRHDKKPSIQVEKTADPKWVNEGSDDLITYTYKLTNTSKSAHDPLTVKWLIDDNGTPGDPSDDIKIVVNGVLQPGFNVVKTGGDQDDLLEKGETWTYTATISAENLNAGKLVNKVKVVANDDECDIAIDTDKAKVKVKDVDPAVAIQKLVDADGDDEFHDSEQIQAGTPTDVVYRYVVTNESAASTDPLTITSLIDDNGTPGDPSDDIALVIGGVLQSGVTLQKSGTDDGDDLLEHGEIWTYSITRTGVVLANGATLTNTVVVEAKDDECNTTTASDTATVEGAGEPPPEFQLFISKTVAWIEGSSIPLTVDSVGDVIHYSILVWSDVTADAYLTGVTVTDPLADNPPGVVRALDIYGDNDNLLEKDEIWHYTASHVVTADEFNNNIILNNTATADSNETGPASDNAHVFIQRQPPVEVAFAITVASEDPANPVPDASATIVEQVAGDDTATFTIAMSGGPLTGGNTASVTLSIDPGSMAVDADFTAAIIQAVADAATAAGIGVSGQMATSLVLTWGAGDPPSFDVDLTAFNDDLVDSGENLTLTLSSATIDEGTASITTPSATATILDNDVAVEFAITVASEDPANPVPDASATIVEQVAGDDTATFTIAMSGGPLTGGNTASVTLSIDLGSTAVDADFTAAIIQAVADAATAAGIGVSGQTLTQLTLTWEAGDPLSFDVDLTAFNDDLVDSGENLTLTLSSATIDEGTASITTPSATAIILDDDGLLIVGSNLDDDATSVPGATDDHVVPKPGVPEGVIDGTPGNDILIGDPGDVPVIVEGDIANIVLVLDSSGSMSASINGTTRMVALQQAVSDLLDLLHNSPAQKITVHIIDFDSFAVPLGTFIVKGGANAAADDAAVAAAKTAVNAMAVGGGTNYEDGLRHAAEWIDGKSMIASAAGIDVSTNAGTQTGQLLSVEDLNSGAINVGVVSGWTRSTNMTGVELDNWKNGTTAAPGLTIGNVNGGVDVGWGVGASGEGFPRFDGNEFLRFDFGAEETGATFGGNYNPPGTFNGPAIFKATFDFKGFTDNTTVHYRVTFVDNTFASGTIDFNQGSTTSATHTFGDGTKAIAYIEFYSLGAAGNIHLASVVSHALAHPDLDANVNKVLFVSDGAPTYYFQGNYGSLGGTGNTTTNELQHILGSGDSDNTNEVSLIENNSNFPIHPFAIEAVGINVGEAALDILDQVEGENAQDPPNHFASNATTGAELSALIGGLGGGGLAQSAAGSDVIVGGAGHDIIFGDVPWTDALATAEGLGTLPGSGWLVFAQLEGGAGNGSADPSGGGPGAWTRADTIAYIKANPEEIAQESGRSGGHDTIDGGAGNDLIFGQEGNDIIVGGLGDDTLVGGSGNDTFTGGSGNDTLTGGDGNDIFRFNAPSEGIDDITDFVVTDDKIQLDDAGFAGIGLPGTLAATAFTTGPAATTAAHRIIYDDMTGALLYDPDGNGAELAIKFAELATGLSLTNTHFEVI